MWPVIAPQMDSGETFGLCISRVRNPDLRQRLRDIRPLIEAAAEDYDAKAKAAELYLIEEAKSVGGTVTVAEMVAVYDQRMAGQRGPGREIYDRLMLLPEGDRCPFCDQRNVSTLDHVLPKALFPALAVTPINLVASCFECNKMKHGHAPVSAADTILHPYYEDLSGEPWLRAQVVESSPCALLFVVSPPAGWGPILEQRIKAQFELLGLGKLYGSEAAREIANIRHNLCQHFNAGGPEGVWAELDRQWQSRRANRLNSWQTATYEALADSDWFCNGGFDL